MFLRVAGAVFLAMISLAPAAFAHGGVRIEKDQCVLKIGPDLMHFTGYQPLQTTQQFCEDIPAVGPTVIVLDAVDAELRDMTTEIRVIRDAGGGGVIGQSPLLSDADLSSDYLDPLTVAYLPPQRYPTGTVNFQHVFEEPGFYIGIVIARNEHGQFYISQFPFSVGRGWIKVAAFYGLLVAAILGGLFLYWKFDLARHGFLGKATADKRMR